MLVECFEILVAVLIVAAVGVPAAAFFDKWKKEMDAEEEK